MHILGGLVIFIQFCFAFHVFMTRRPYWWMFVIMGFPVMGCIIYYFVEVFPGSREHRQAHKAARKIAKALRPDADLKRLVEELEVCGSVDNRIQLAAECMSHQMYDEAERLYESCLTGAFQNDAAILLGLARAAVEHGNWQKSGDAIARLKALGSSANVNEVKLLDARMLEGLAQNDAALKAYQELVPIYVGLEARYRYAMLLSELGQRESAAQVLNEVLKHAKRFSSSLEDERHWAEAARRAVAAVGAE